MRPDGTLDRPKLGQVIFNDDAKRQKLNAIVHPAVQRAMIWGVIKCWLKGNKLCILDVPLLIEVGLWKWMGFVVVVYWCVTLFALKALSDVGASARSRFR